MKVNLQNYILDSNTYLLQLYENITLEHKNYENYLYAHTKIKTYPKLIELCDEHNININPYLYTLDIISHKDLKAFNLFYNIYMKKNDFISQDDNTLNSILIAEKSIDNLIAFIITIQYFFL